MQLNETTRDALKRHPVIGTEPKDGYVLGRVHPHRLRFRSLKTEARVLLKSLTRRDDPRKLLIFARPRSGTTLLTQLLGQVPDLRCDGELLHDVVIAPGLYLRRLARRANAGAYGVKLLSYQMLEVQRIRDPLGFMARLVDDGWHIVHLRRRTWEQTMSLVVAQSTGQYFERGRQLDDTELAIPPDRFLRQLVWSRNMLDFEDALMDELPHIRLQYEDDLSDPETHQRTIDQICARLGHPTGPVAARMRRTGGERGAFKVTNRDALRDAVRGTELAPLLDAG
ncbi:MAG: hypothetical protein AAF919_10870 [Pseudomonadota bacterium]